ncbi:TonB-dependent receptor [Pontibacter sp. BT310]|uniref:TonB-dependent receptor n=1 Tax=Pontibacter populi TaxID=890055 RepID=A0ABS6XCK3_9BACT|nr:MULTISPECIES: TonB-dependent receptor [Pontibacter]MBJ6118874.1 TonB-dependent receptor [Pontibacter sp. BT310]MBR0571302.1 TonB-dependent receptor [Microvirga sp. STS03]MBW3365728.1 TonB-dependent receptor [Pontibacter populi]
MAQFYRNLFLLIVFFSGVIVTGFAQQVNDPLVTGNYTNTTFRTFVEDLEAQTRFIFYFDPVVTDSITVDIQVTAQPLSKVLTQALLGTNLRFAISEEQQVFITSEKQVLTSLPDNFFNNGSKSKEVDNTQLADFYLPQQKKQKKAVSEIKLYEIGNAGGQSKANLAGTIRDANTGEPIIGAYVYIESPTIGTASDQYGYYSLTLPVGRHELKIRGIGLKNAKRQVLLNGDGKLDIDMEEDVRSLKEVLVEAEKDKNVSGLQMGMERLDIRTIKQVPTAFGETDILRVVQTLPGVKSVGEGSTGMNVRGGSTDQNLILLNDATIYNPSHLFGFFSAFNPDVLKSVELYKSAVPARYGGRLSSVLEVTTREGNKKQFSGAGGIGLLTSRLTLEGPIIKDKTSFLLGGRTTYSDWILKQLPNKSFKNSEASFYDINAHISHEIDSKNSVFFTGYISKDRFKLDADTLYRFKNQNASLKWKHNFHNKLYSVVTGTHSHYSYDISNEGNAVNAATLAFGIDQSNLQVDFNYFPNEKHTVDFGASSIFYQSSPGSLTPHSQESLISEDIIQKEKAVESAIYISDRYDISPRLSVSVGLRYSMFTALGPRDVYTYAPGIPKTESSMTDTVSYSSGEPIATYHGPEFRLSAKYNLTDNSSVKLSYNRLRQYMHMLSNTASMSPTDTWKLSDSNIKPQVGDQVAIGYYRNFRANTIEFSAETYYKWMQDFLDYRSGASIIMNHHIETDVANAEGKAYGVELMVKKATGKMNGWVSYTYSRTLARVNDPNTSEVINRGEYYPSNYDKPHDFTLISNYRFSQRFSTSLNFTYSTGRPITLPIAKYYDGSAQRVLYSDRNQYRVPDYYRVDFAMNIEGNHKVNKLAHSSWTVAVYNLTGRKNPYSIYFKSDKNKIRGYKMSVFGQPIPTVTYNFKF